jgi:hypothetical protein
MSPVRRRRLLAYLSAFALVVIVAGCGSTSAADQATEQKKAAQLVSAVHAAGLAPHLTTDVAEALYGTDAPTVCDVFEDGLTTAEENDLLGNPSGRRAKTITTDAVAYGRIVVTTYCPAELANFQKAVDHLDPVESDQ